MIKKCILFISLLLVSCTQQFTVGDVDIAYILNHEKMQNPQDTSVESFNQESIKQLKSVASPIKIIGVFGFWCHDSQREVPRMIELLKTVDNPNIKVQFIALDTDKEEPNNRHQDYQVKFTPTFIVLKDGVELGRIVEKPKLSLEQDLVTILKP